MLAFNFGFLFLPEIHGQDQTYCFKFTTDSPDLFLVKIQPASYHKIIIDPLLFVLHTFILMSLFEPST